MRSINNTVLVDTHEKQQLLNLTSSVCNAVDASGIQSGFVGIYSRHTNGIGVRQRVPGGTYG